MATCPECDADLPVDEHDLEEGDSVDCAECGETFVVTGTDPLELELAEDAEEEEEEEDEDEGEDEGDFDDEDDLEDEEDEGDLDE